MARWQSHRHRAIWEAKHILPLQRDHRGVGAKAGRKSSLLWVLRQVPGGCTGVTVEGRAGGMVGRMCPLAGVFSPPFGSCCGLLILVVPPWAPALWQGHGSLVGLQGCASHQGLSSRGISGPTGFLGALPAAPGLCHLLV